MTSRAGAGAVEGDRSDGGTPARRVVLVAAVARNGVIGVGGDLPWRIAADLRHFRETTTGHTVLMGRATYDSIGRPLPGRTTVVVTRQPDWSREGVHVAHSVAEGIELARSLPGDVMVVGGGEVYRQALPVATHQVLTEVDLEPEGDTFYPDFDRAQWRETSREAHDGYAFVHLERTS